VPIIDVMQLPDYWYLPQLVVYEPGSQDQFQQCHCELALQIPAIKDPDPTVNLEYRWFIDYDINNVQQSWAEDLTLPGAFNSTNEVRGPVVFNFNTDAQQLQASTTPHTVDFVIAEQGAFTAVTATQPHHRALNTGFDATALRVVVLVHDAVGPRCDLVAGVPSATQRICAGP
jgi:hypothetical protein